MTTPAEAVEGEVICGAMASKCICTKPPDHVESGDPAHLCTGRDCGGSWTGTYERDDFVVLSFPMIGGV